MIKDKALGCFVVGILFAVFALFIHFSYENKKNELDGNTISIKTTYTTKKSKYRSESRHRHRHRHKHETKTMYQPTYQFVVNNKTYFCTPNSSSSVKPSNKPITIYYDSTNPNNCLPQKGYTENVILIVIGLMSIVSICFGFKEIVNPSKDI